MSRRVYEVSLKINGHEFKQVLIDPHFEEKHIDSVNDQIIMGLVDLLNGKSFSPVDIDDEGFNYFVNDRLELNGKFFKLIWLTHQDYVYVGIVNAYRR